MKLNIKCSYDSQDSSAVRTINSNNINYIRRVARESNRGAGVTIYDDDGIEYYIDQDCSSDCYLLLDSEHHREILR